MRGQIRGSELLGSVTGKRTASMELTRRDVVREGRERGWKEREGGRERGEGEGGGIQVCVKQCGNQGPIILSICRSQT